MKDTNTPPRQNFTWLFLGSRLNDKAALTICAPGMQKYSATDKKMLPSLDGGCYGSLAPAKSGAGRENPDMFEAIPDADSVFFYIAALAHLTAYCRIESMVALVGQLSGWPVLSNAGILTPISVTTHQERENSGGDSLISFEELPQMANSAYPQSVHASAPEATHA